MASIRLLLGIICFVAVSSNRQSNSHLLNTDNQQREKLLAIASQEIGVIEATGNNDGERVSAYLASVHLKKGQPWCAAFVSWVFMQGGYSLPRTAWSPDLFTARVKTKQILPANVMGIWFPKLNRIAHVGLEERQQGNWLILIEGNTNVAGSREGDGVYRKRRLVKSIATHADWLRIKKGAKP